MYRRSYYMINGYAIRTCVRVHYNSYNNLIIHRIVTIYRKWCSTKKITQKIYDIRYDTLCDE